VITMRAGAQMLLRLALALAIVGGSVAFFRGLVVPGLQGVFHLEDATTSALRRGGILLVALAAYWAYVRAVEKRAVTEIRFAPAAVALALASGAALISITTLTLFVSRIYEVVSVRGVSTPLAGTACVILIAAMLEEIFFRGIVFRILETVLGTLPALWSESLIFAVLHLPNIVGADAMTAVTMVSSATLMGALWTMIFVHTRNLWVVGTHHAAWNFAILLTGLPLSGVEEWRGIAPFESRYQGPDWLTGGAFGPEDSVITIGIVMSCLGALIYWARRRNRILGARAPR
jgi:membrane protease YdiL (CAAX protease family)